MEEPCEPTLRSTLADAVRNETWSTRPEAGLDPATGHLGRFPPNTAVIPGTRIPRSPLGSDHQHRDLRPLEPRSIRSCGRKDQSQRQHHKAQAEQDPSPVHGHQGTLSIRAACGKSNIAT